MFPLHFDGVDDSVWFHTQKSEKGPNCPFFCISRVNGNEPVAVPKRMRVHWNPNMRYYGISEKAPSAKSSLVVLPVPHYWDMQCVIDVICGHRLVQKRSSAENFALKMIDRVSWTRLKHATRRKVNLLDEVEIMTEADHPNIVKVLEFFEAEKTVNVILDYCVGGDLLEYIQDHGGTVVHGCTYGV